MSDINYIVDLGSRSIKFGKSDDEKPSTLIPHIYSDQRSYFGEKALEEDTIRYGNQRQENSVKIIDFNPNDIVKIIKRLQQIEGTDFSKDCGTLFGVNYGIGINYLKCLCETFMESTESLGMHIVGNPYLEVLASGCTTGIALDVGDVFSSVAAVFEGITIAKSRALPLAGRDITNYLRELLNNYSLNQMPKSQELLYKIKEENCFIALPNFEAAYQNKDKTQSDRQELLKLVEIGHYGQQISIDTERFLAPEILFKPNILGKDIEGVQYLVSDVLSEAHISSRSRLLENFCIGGGSTMFHGFSDRIQFELSFLHQDIFSKLKIRTNTHSNINAAWKGGVIEATKKNKFGDWLGKEVYNESGCNVYLKEINL